MPRHTAPASFLPLRKFSHYYMQFICVVLAGSLLAADSVAAQAAATNLQTGCVTNYDPNTDYFPEKIDGSNSPHLTYTYAKNYKTIFNSFSNETTVLYQCGTPKPDVKAKNIIAVPITSVTVGDTTVVTYLELLGKRSAIKVTSGGTLGYISSPCVQALVAANPSAIIEADAKNKTHALEQITSTDAYFQWYGTLASNATNAVTFPASGDPGVAGRAEWIGFVASFFNLEAKANQISTAFNTNYAALSTAANAAKSPKPVVAWIEHMSAYPPDYPEAWIIHANQYQLDYVNASGAVAYIPATTEGTSSVTGLKTQAITYNYDTASAFLKALAPVDIVIDLSFASVNSTDFATSFGVSLASTQYKFLTNKQIYMTNKAISAENGGNAWFESGTVMENVVLADIISFTHPEVVGSSYVPTYFRNAFKDQQVVLTAQSCKDVTAAEVVPVIQVAKTSGAEKVVAAFALALVAALL